MVPHRWTARCSVASLLDPDMFCLATFLNEHSFDAPAQGREQLLLETGDRPHAATARKIRRAARQMAPSAVGDSIRNAQIAAEANFELARVRAAFEAVVARMSISHTSNAGPGDTCSTGSGKSAAPIRTLAELDKLDRYERRERTRQIDERERRRAAGRADSPRPIRY